MGKYLRLFLDQLPQQTCFDRLEVVLDHNEPSAEELQWVSDFQSRYPGKLKHLIVDPVLPIGTSMNRCIKESQGDYLAIWNVDDLRTPHSLQAQLDTLLEHPEAGICYGNFTVVAQFGSQTGRYFECKGIPDLETTRSMIFGPFFMFKKSLCINAGIFDEQLKSGADFDLAIRLAFQTSAVWATSDLGYYLNEGLGASTRPGSLQPIERTVIELRYGIYDKIDYSYVAQAAAYDIQHIHVDGERHSISSFVPNYTMVMRERFQSWHAKGLRSFVWGYFKQRLKGYFQRKKH